MLLPSATMREAVVVLAHHRGLAMVCERDRLQGVLTAGDLSRVAERQGDYWTLRVDQVMTREPKTCHADDVAAATVGVMERHGIMAVPVIEDGDRVVGVVHLHDLMRAGAV
jgi:arabinose-5-phosphate isomerase